MSFLTDVGGKLVQSFLSLDDLVFGQGLVRDGVAGLSEAGRSAVGAVAISSNVAARALQFGVQTGAKTARVTAAALEGLMPGVDVAQDFAERVDRRATAAGEEASLLAAYGLELVGGSASQARNPLTGEPWLQKQVPYGYGWGELGADTAIGSLGKVAALPMTVSLDAFEALAHTSAGDRARDALLGSLHSFLDRRPGEGKNDSVDLEGLRELFAAATSSSAVSALRDVVHLAEAFLRFSLGDLRRLRETFEENIDDMRQIAEHEKIGEVIPGMPLGELLQHRARRVADNVPSRLLAALEPAKDGTPPKLGPVLSALLDEAPKVRVLLIEYPQALALLATNLGVLLGAGLLDASEIEAYVRDDSHDKEATKTRPWSATMLELTLGKAEVVAAANPESGPFPRTAIHLAQDTVFTYSSEALGRGKALTRIERLFGRKVRERLAADPSLEAEVMDAEQGEKRNAKLRQLVASLDGAELSYRWKKADEQLDSLRAFEKTIYNQSPDKIAERISTLDTFLSFAGQALALESVPVTTDGRLDALRRFEAWVGAQGAKS